MASWIYITYPPRDDFAETMTDEEAAVFSEHFAYLQTLLGNGSLILAGPTLGRENLGIAIFDAADRAAAESIMASDPVVASRIVTPELREMRVSLLRGR